MAKQQRTYTENINVKCHILTCFKHNPLFEYNCVYTITVYIFQDDTTHSDYL